MEAINMADFTVLDKQDEIYNVIDKKKLKDTQKMN